MAVERLDYTRRTFSTLVVDALRYIQHYIPSIESTANSNPGIRFIRLCVGVVDVLLRYLDLTFEERSLSRCKQLRNQMRNSEILNYKFDGPAGASGIAQFTQTGGVGDVPQWQALTTGVGTLIRYLTTQLGAAPGVGLTVDVPIVQGVRHVDEVLAEASDGSFSQVYILLNNFPVKSYVTIEVGGLSWTRVDDLMEYGAADEVFEVTYDDQMFGFVIFGDNENGESPALGDRITSTYVSTVGVSGEANAGTITVAPALGDYEVTNPSGTSGGSDGDTVDSIRRNAPQQFSTVWRAVTPEDFEALATSVADVYSARAEFISGYYMTVRIIPVGGGDPTAGLLTDVYDYILPRMMYGTQLTATGFDPATMLVTSSIKLKSRQWSKVDAEVLIRAAVEEFLNYTNAVVGSAWAPSDYHAHLEGLENGNLIEVVDTLVFSRVPRTVENPEAAGTDLELSAIQVNASCGYANWVIHRKSDTEFYLYKNDTLDPDSGTVDVEYTSNGGEITFTLTQTTPPDLIPVGAAWSFSTSKANGPVKINGDEVAQPFGDNTLYFALTLYFPDEWFLE